MITLSKNRPNMWCVIDSTLNTFYTPARRWGDRHTGPAESDNPEVQGLHSKATTVQSSKSNSSRLLA